MEMHLVHYKVIVMVISLKPTCANQASLGNIGAAVEEGAPDSLAVLGFFFEVLHVHLDVHHDEHLDAHQDEHFNVHLDKHLDVYLDVFDAWLLLRGERITTPIKDCCIGSNPSHICVGPRGHDNIHDDMIMYVIHT